MKKDDYIYVLDLLEEAYEYASEMKKYADEPDKNLLENIQCIIADVEKRLEAYK